MIALTRLNFAPVLLNSDLIETVETTPDTVIRLTNGQKLIVREGAAEVLEKVTQFRISVLRGENQGPPNSVFPAAIQLEQSPLRVV